VQGKASSHAAGKMGFVSLGSCISDVYILPSCVLKIKIFTSRSSEEKKKYQPRAGQGIQVVCWVMTAERVIPYQVQQNRPFACQKALYKRDTVKYITHKRDL
jgi:hypothetical protein